jgi:hypothetical protein
VIAKIPSKRKDGKSSFKELIQYVRGKDGERAVHTEFQGISSVKSAAVEMETVAFTNVRCKDPVFHFILSWRELEVPTTEQADEAVQIALKELDLQNCQAIWALQNDTENRHVHVVVNRIHPETGKAIQPAGNWTYKALERAARKIEMAQGWEIEKTGRYHVDENGLEETRMDELEPRISQTARDIEAHTGEKSAERTGQEIAAPIIREARDWEELHRKLAEQGIAFERKGSGAVLHIGGTVIKASQAGRDISLSKLEKKLGTYRKRDASVALDTSKPEAIERVNTVPKVKKSWEEYQKAKTEYLSAKKEVFAGQKKRDETERKSLLARQRKERSELFRVSWKGRGAELNRQRSLIAAEQQKAKLDLRDRQKKEYEELKKIFPTRFPNFKAWLEQEENPELSVLFRYTDSLVLLGDSAAVNAEEADLRAYTALSGNKGGVAYVREKKAEEKGFFHLAMLKTPEADFIDYGRKILLSKNCDETAVLAALQLANQKWGTVWINGTEEYKQMCVNVAIKHNLKLANPDLAQKVKEGRNMERENSQTKQEKQTEFRKIPVSSSDPVALSSRLFEQYADAVGAERYRVTATEFTPEGVKAFVFDKKNGGLEGKTRKEILEAMPKLLTYVKYDKNICVTPMSADKHHLLIDDMTGDKLNQLKENGYSPACVIESSPGNFQAILTIPKLKIGDGERSLIETGPLEKAETTDREAANRLVKELNQKYGDPKLSGAVHAHRLPPFPNLKPKHRREDGTFPETVLVEANGGMCPKAAKQLEEIQERLNQEAREREKQTTNTAAMNFQGTGVQDPNRAYWTHYRDILSRSPDVLDYSRIDGMIGIRMRVTGHSASQVYEAIKTNASTMRKETMNADEYAAKYRNRDWSRYAKETTENFVFGPRGVNQYSQAEAFRAYYMVLEGQDYTSRDTTRREKTSKDIGR